MKINKIFSIFMVGLALFTTSCSDFLDQEPESKLPPDKVFSDVKTTNAYILGLYSSWREGHKGRVDMFLGTDEAVVGGFQHDDISRGSLDTYSEGMNSTNTRIRGIWTNRYEVISRAAPAISYLKKLQDSGNKELNELLGEACFLRAENNWELTMLFGPIPIIDHDRLDYGGFRQPLDVVYANIEEDLLIAEKYLPEPNEVSNPGRVSKALAQAFLGKLYLYAPESSGFRNYAKAAEHFKKVVNNPYFGGTGATDYAVIFDAYSENSGDYKKEMVYAFQYNVGWPNNCGTEWEMGSRSVANMTPDLGEAMAPWSGFDGIMPSEYCYKTTSNAGLWEDGDVRKNESIRYDFTWRSYVPNMNGYAWGDELEPHVKKYEDPRTVDKGQNTWHSGKSIPFVRYGDIVLNYAECLYMTGNQAEGINLINNVIRKRAFGGTLPADKMWSTGMGQDQFTENLMNERMRELCFEGWRKFDLLRTGLTQKYAEKRNRWLIGGEWTNRFGNTKELGSPLTIASYKLLWPIPLDELRQNPDLTDNDQNPGYTTN